MSVWTMLSQRNSRLESRPSKDASLDLKDFIARALSDIVSGVVDAQAKLSDKGAHINPQEMFKTQPDVYSVTMQRIHIVEFDVAVTVAKTDENKAGIGVVAGAIGLGVQERSMSNDSALSRIKFSVPITLPYGATRPQPQTL